MVVSTGLAYRAFLCSAFGDDDGAKALLRGIKAYRLDADQAKRAKQPGPVDSSGAGSLTPIFRPRALTLSGAALPTDIATALDKSAALLLVCTSMAAGDRAVGEAVRYFKHRYPDRPIIPVITDKALGTGLPPALRFALNADGGLSRDPITITPVDLRATGDGKTFGMAKVVAGLLGIEDAHPLYHRAQWRDSQSSRRGWTASLAALAVALGGAAVWGESNREQAVSDRAAVVAQTRLADEQRVAADAGVKETEELRKLVDQKTKETEAQLKSGGEQSGVVAQLRSEADDLRKQVSTERGLSGQLRTEADGLRKASGGQDGVIAQLRKDIDALRKAAEAKPAIAIAAPPSADAALQKSLVTKLQREIDDQRKATEIQNSLAEQHRKDADAKGKAAAEQQDLALRLRQELDDQRKATEIQHGLAEQRRLDAESRSIAASQQLTLVERLRKDLDDQRKATDIQNGLSEQRRLEAEQQHLAVSAQAGQIEQLRKDVEAQRKLTAEQGVLAVQRLAEVDGFRKGAEELKALAARRGQETEAQRAEAEKLRLDADLRLSAAEASTDDLILSMLRATRGRPGLAGPLADTLLGSIERVAGERVERRSTQVDSLRRQQAIYNELALLYASRGLVDARETATRRSLDVSQRLAELDKGSPASLSELAAAQMRSGDLQVSGGNLAEAFKSYQAAIVLRERLIGADAGDGAAHRALAASYESLGRVRSLQRDAGGARLSYQGALAAALKMPEPGLSETATVRYLIGLHKTLARLGDDPPTHRSEILRLLQDLKARGVAVAGDVRALPVLKADAPSDTVAAATTKPVLKLRHRLKRSAPPDAAASIFGG